MKIFIDAGAYTGDTIHIARNMTADGFDKFIAFEPLVENCVKLDRIYGTCENVEIRQESLSDSFTVKKLYLNKNSNMNGNSLNANKNNVTKDFILTKCYSASQLISSFIGEEIHIKLNVEGEEYPILKDLIKNDLLKHISKLYVEWHWNKIIGMEQEEHTALVKQINTWFPSITGINPNDITPFIEDVNYGK